MNKSVNPLIQKLSKRYQGTPFFEMALSAWLSAGLSLLAAEGVLPGFSDFSHSQGIFIGTAMCSVSALCMVIALASGRWSGS